MRLPSYEPWLQYFERSVLRHYRAEPNRYQLQEDDLGGVLENNAGELIDVRFGFRRLSDGSICVAALDIDIARMPTREQQRWTGFRIENPEFSDVDPGFERWASRNLEGAWEVQDGPIPQLRNLIRLINSLTRQTIGEPLWRTNWNNLVNYPQAENTDAYADAHLELYRILIDSLNLIALQQIASRSNIQLKDPTKSMNSLKELLPLQLQTVVHAPIKKCYDQRQKKHGVPSAGSQRFPAFDTFHQDVAQIVAGLDVLREWLEQVVSASAAACLKREETMASGSFPKFSGPPKPEHKWRTIQQAEGKTITRIEFGTEQSSSERHEAEAIVFHFNDGSALSILIGSNVRNLLHRYEDLKPNDFHTDLMVFWAPPIKLLNS